MNAQIPPRRPRRRPTRPRTGPLSALTGDLGDVVQERIAQTLNETLADMGIQDVSTWGRTDRDVLSDMLAEYSSPTAIKGRPTPDPARRTHNRQQAKLFDELATYFSEPVAPDTQERLAQIVASANIRTGEAVLDVGTGTGVLLPIILAQGTSRVAACDLSREMIARARASFKGRVRFFRKDVIDLAGSLGLVDVVFCNACFSNFYDPLATLRSINALCFYGARVVISHPLGREFVRHLKAEHPGMVTAELPDYAEVETLLNSTGFRVELFQNLPDLYIVVGRKVDNAVPPDHTTYGGPGILDA